MTRTSISRASSAMRRPSEGLKPGWRFSVMTGTPAASTSAAQAPGSSRQQTDIRNRRDRRTAISMVRRSVPPGTRLNTSCMTPGAGASRIMGGSEGLARNCHYRLNPMHRSAGPPSGGPRPIVFFDGDCGLCDRFVRFLVARDRRQRLHYAPLQGDTARQLIPPATAESIDSVILLDEDGLHLRSEAALRAIAHLGGVWRLGGALRAHSRRPARRGL